MPEGSEYEGLLGFLQSPEAMGLAQGLLAAGQPSMQGPQTLGGGLANGLSLMQDIRERERNYKLKQDELKMRQEMAQLQKRQLEQALAAAQGDRELTRKIYEGLLASTSALSGDSQEGVLESGNQAAGMGMLFPELDPKQREKALLKLATGDRKGAIESIYEETPNAKTQRELAKARATEEMKLDFPTTGTVTKNQSTITAIDNVIPELEDLKKLDRGLINLNPQANALYQGEIAGIIDALVNALGLTSTKENVELARQMVEKQPAETSQAYKKRLDGVIGKLKKRKATSQKNLLGAGAKAGQEEGEVLNFNPETGGFY